MTRRAILDINKACAMDVAVSHPESRHPGRRLAAEGLAGTSIKLKLDGTKLNTSRLKREIEKELQKNLSEDEKAELCYTTIDVFVDDKLYQKCERIPDRDDVHIGFIRRYATKQEYYAKCDEEHRIAFFQGLGVTEEDFHAMDERAMVDLLFNLSPVASDHGEIDGGVCSDCVFKKHTRCA